MARIGYDEAIVRQRDVLPESAEHIRTQLARQRRGPFAAGTVGVIGIGASLNAAHLLAHLLRIGGRAAIAIPASMFAAADPLPAIVDVAVIISESGDSTEVIQAAAELTAAHLPTLSLTNAPTSTLARMTDMHVDLECGPDSGVYTVGFTATVQATALLAEWLGAPSSQTQLTSKLDVPGMDVLPAAAEQLAGCRGVDAIGAGLHLGSAFQTQLMMREGCRMPSTAFDTREYLHGPHEWLTQDSGCMVFGTGRELQLARFAASVGAHVLHFRGPNDAEEDGVPTPAEPRVVRLTATGVTAVLQETIAVQHLVSLIGQIRGIPVGLMRYPQPDTKRTGVY